MKHDDVVDALAYQGILIDKMSEGLTQEELQEEEYEEDYRDSDLYNLGRNLDTGY